MRTTIYSAAALLGFGVILLQTGAATLIPSLSFEQLTDSSELIVSGQITNSWTAWDADHRFIWTHYQLSVASAVKGSPAATVEFAEPGGAFEGRVMTIAGTVTYGIGENLVVFLSRMPNGYLRTAGWAQGKYALDARGRLHGQAAAGSSLQTVDGMSFAELGQRVAARLRAAQGKVQ